MSRTLKFALVGFGALAIFGWGLGQVMTGQGAGQQAYVAYGCFDCHGNFDNGGTPVDRDPGNPNADGGMGPAIVGWGAEDLKAALFDGTYQAINYYKTRAPEAEVFGEDELSDQDLMDITAWLNPDYAGGDADNGALLYRETCFACHGSDALGNNLVGPPIVKKSFEVVKAVARTGILPVRMQGLMPTYNGVIDDGTLNALADYLVGLIP
jgi:mono/diheme cytochrome c family protein